MKKVILFTLLLHGVLAMPALITETRAQQNKVIVWVEQIYSYDDHDTGSDDEYRVKYSVNGVETCATAPDGDNRNWINMHDNGIETYIAASASSFTMNLAAWEDDGGVDCSYDGGDDGYHGISYQTQLSSYPPMTWIQVERVVNNNVASNHGYRIKYYLYWESPKLNPPGRNNGTIMCHNDNLTISTNAHGVAGALSPTYRWRLTVAGVSRDYYTSQPTFDLRTHFTTSPTVDVPVNVTVTTFAMGSQAGAESDPTQFTITPGAPVFSVGTITQISCPGGKGSITINGISGGTNAYDIALINTTTQEPQSAFNVGPNAPYTFANLDAGNYKVIVSNRNGSSCAAPAVENLIIGTAPAPLMIQPHGTSVRCYNSSDGSFAPTASGGTAPYGFTVFRNGLQVPLSGLPAASDYVIVVTDSRGCTAQLSNAVIGDRLPLVVNGAEVSNISCYQGTDGIISAPHVSGGVGPYQYKLSNASGFLNDWQTGDTFESLALGTGSYDLTIKDANGCETTEVVAIDAPDQPVLGTVVNHEDVTCFGLSDASITVRGAGGEGGPYQFSINQEPYTSSSVDVSFTDLAAGHHTLRVKEGPCESEVIAWDITEPLPLQAASQVTTVSCNGGADGVVQYTLSGGTGPYFVLDPVSNTPVEVDAVTNVWLVSNLAAGVQSLSIRDARGCTNPNQDEWYTLSVIVSEPAALMAIVNAQDIAGPDCFQQATATVTVHADGGTPDYQFSSDGTVFHVPNGDDGNPTDQFEFQNLSGNTDYTFYLRDARSCLTQIQVHVPETPLLELSVTEKTDVDCKGNATGFVKLVGQGGTGTYGYANNVAGPFSSVDSFDQLPAGNYSFFIRDANQCISQTDVTIAEPAASLTASAAVTNVSCFGLQDGKVIVTASGANGSYRFSRNGGTFQASHVFSNLPQGNNTIVVTDVKNCSVTINNIVITEPAILQATASAIGTVTCANGSDATFKVNPTGGTAPYTYALMNDDWHAHPYTFTGLMAGTYTVIVRDQQACSTTLTVDMSASPPAIEADVTAVNALCGESNGSAEVVAVRHAQAPFSWQWLTSTGAVITTGNRLEHVPANEYIIKVTDSRNCELQQSVFIANDNTNLQVAVSELEPTTCHESHDGAARLTLSGATGPFLITWPNGQQETVADVTVTFDQFSIGLSTVQIRDADQCLTALPVTIPGPDPLNVTTDDVHAPRCFDTATGEATVSATGGNGGYLFSLYQGTQLIAEQTDPAFTGLPAAGYRITATDNKGCMDDYNFAIAQEVLPVITSLISSADSHCEISADGGATFAVTGGTAPFQYHLWDEENNLITTSSTPVFNQLAGGRYRLEVVDAHACPSSDFSITIGIQPDPAISWNKQPVTCPDVCDGVLEIVLDNPETYVFNVDGVGSTSSVFESLCVGSHAVTIQHQSGCTYRRLVAMDVAANRQLELGDARVICVGQVVTLAPGIAGSYQWTASNGFVSDDATVALNQPGLYRLVILTPEGCSLRDSLEIATSDELLKADLLMSDEAVAGDTLIGIDLTMPAPQRRVWTFDATQIVHVRSTPPYEYFKFPEPGTQQIELLVEWEGCKDTLLHVVLVTPRQRPEEPDTPLGYREPLIKNLVAFPNPANGPMTITLELSRPSSAVASLTHALSSGSLMTFTSDKQLTHQWQINPAGIGPGVYLLTIVTGEGASKTIRIIFL